MKTAANAKSVFWITLREPHTPVLFRKTDTWFVPGTVLNTLGNSFNSHDNLLRAFPFYRSGNQDYKAGSSQIQQEGHTVGTRYDFMIQTTEGCVY